MLLPHLLRLDLSRQSPPPERQRRHIQQQSRLLQGQPLLSLDHLNLIFSNKRLSLPLNHRLHLRPLYCLLPLFNLIKPLGARIRTSLCNSLPGNEFQFTISANLDNSQIATHSGVSTPFRKQFLVRVFLFLRSFCSTRPESYCPMIHAAF